MALVPTAGAEQLGPLERAAGVVLGEKGIVAAGVVSLQAASGKARNVDSPQPIRRYTLAPVNTAGAELPGPLERARLRLKAVMAGTYETGIEPGYKQRSTPPTRDEPSELFRIYQPHMADRTVKELVTAASLGQTAARLWNAQWIQLWGTLFLNKPCGVAQKGNIGWHQDQHYFTTIWEPKSEVFFASIALSDIGPDSGPVMMIRGSHRWGYRGEGDFYGQAMETVRKGVHVPEGEQWEEVATTMPSGAVSFHHKNTFHGSLANHSGVPRLSILIFLRTERSQPLPDSDSYWLQNIDDPEICPVIYGDDGQR